jgi:outer membrane protein OmpA-like peptidoglycan-associated protein
VQPPPHAPPTLAPAQVPPTNAPAQNQPPRRQAPPQAPAQTQPPPQQPTTAAPAQVPPPPRQPQLAPTQAAPAAPAPARPPQAPAANIAPPPPMPAPTAAQARPLQRTQGPAAIVLTTPQGQPLHRVDQLRAERREVVEGNRTIIREPDRVIVREANGIAFIRHNDVDRFRYGARDVRVETRGRDSVTTVVLPNGQRVVTVLDADGRLLRRSRWVDGREIVIIDQRPVAPGFGFFIQLPPPIVRIPRERYIVDLEAAPPALIYDTLMAPPVEAIDQGYSLDQVRYSYSLRERMPSIDIDTINFETGSWEVLPDQVDRLAAIADGINRAIQANPREVFLIEGHTDAVGNDVDNLSLSDRRAETVALILSDKFGVPPENLVTQGYGRQYLKIPTDGPERRNRRVTVRRITPLLEQQAGGPPPGPPPQ